MYILHAYCVYAISIIIIFFFWDKKRTRKFVRCEMKNEIKGNSCRLQKKKGKKEK